MSEVTFLLSLYREGKIDAGAINNALNALKALPNPAMQAMEDVQGAQPPPTRQPDEPPQSNALETLRRRRRKKKTEKRQKKAAANEEVKRQKQKYAHLKKAVIDELKKVLAQRTVPELKLVDRPLCDYFKAYEIDAYPYKDPSVLFKDKKISDHRSNQGRHKRVQRNQVLSWSLYRVLPR